MDQTCPHCGFCSADPAPRFCSACGARMDGSTLPLPGSLMMPAVPGQELKSQTLAGFCSSVLPGLGQVYNGEAAKGYVLFLLTLAGLVLLILPGLLVWLYATYDAYAVAGKMNTGEIGYRPASALHMGLFVFIAIMFVFLIILIIITATMSLMMAQLGPEGTRYLGQII